MMKVLKISYYVLMTALLIWFLISWGDIVADNYLSNPIHHPWNMFLLMKGWAA